MTGAPRASSVRAVFARGRLRRPGSPAGIAASVAAAAFALMAVWSVAVPPYSGPDEFSHVIRAVSLVRGAIVGTPDPYLGPAFTYPTVPEVFSIGDELSKCYRLQPDVSAACVPRVATSGPPTQSLTYTGKYPPLYYALVGLPSLVDVAPSGLYLMRLTSALLSAALLGLSVYVIRRWSSAPALALGLLVAATPVTLYLGGVVNPNGLEISAALCLWTSGIVLFGEQRGEAPPGLVAAVGGSAAILTATRGLSPLWTALILAATASLCSRSDLAALRARRAVRIWAAILALVAAVALGWIVAENALALTPAGPLPTGRSDWQVLVAAIHAVGGWFPQMVGVFGWLDTVAPAFAIDLWYLAALAVCALGLALGSGRQRLVLLAVAATGIVASVAIDYSHARNVGLAWQGRYLLPFAGGLPLLATAAFPRAWRPGASGAALAALLGLAELACIYQALRRYAVGASGPLGLAGGWSPPGGVSLVLTGAVLAAAALSASLLLAATPPTR